MITRLTAMMASRFGALRIDLIRCIFFHLPTEAPLRRPP
jgi:hypothetical protein